MKPIIRMNATAARRLRALLEGNSSSLIPCLRLVRAPEGQTTLLLEGIPDEEELVEFAGIALLILDREVLAVLEEEALDYTAASEAPRLNLIK